MPLQATSGAASYDAFGGGVAVVPNYIEDVFSTWLYAGNGSTQTITNGIDLAGKGGLVWIKGRSGTYGAESHNLTDTARGTGFVLFSNATNAQFANTDRVTAFNSNGFSLGSSTQTNGSSTSIASWTFRKQPKFFDVVTYTGDGIDPHTIPHNLGSVPGCVIVKRTDSTSNWFVWHRGSGGATDVTGLNLNSTTAAVYPNMGFNAYFTSTTFRANAVLDTASAAPNVNGATYVAYLFAHNAGGFGLTGTDNVISCGSYIGNNTFNPITLGFEPQFLLLKKATGAGNWYIFDNMRGIATGGNDYQLYPNRPFAEGYGDDLEVTATGFNLLNNSEFNSNPDTIIYIAIRRGPMKVPTDGTKVFSPSVSTAAVGTEITTGFPVDMQFLIGLFAATISNAVDRLRGISSTTTASGRYLEQATTNAEASATVSKNWNNTGFQFPDYFSGLRTLFLNFRRAPGFFDEVCYTGTGVARTINHNLAVVPELMIVKARSGTGLDWVVYAQSQGNTKGGYLNYSLEFETASTFWNNTSPTASLFTLGNNDRVNNASSTFVAYLFATCPGVSKVFSFTGNGSTQTIDCGFTGGARFVLLKASSATGGWYVYDTARGMTVLTDPYLQLNSTAAETATLGSVTTVSTGFAVNEAITTGVNTNGVTYIGLAIA